MVEADKPEAWFFLSTVLHHITLQKRLIKMKEHMHT